jgi:hypothetical protein
MYACIGQLSVTIIKYQGSPLTKKKGLFCRFWQTCCSGPVPRQ